MGTTPGVEDSAGGIVLTAGGGGCPGGGGGGGGGWSGPGPSVKGGRADDAVE
jgi:hypothetical protein